jgi:hypothetical protein
VEPVVDIGGFSTGLEAVVPRMANIATDFAYHMRVHGLDDAIHYFLFGGTLIKPL